MPFSHHSHSGQFCAHAKNTLAEIVETARKKKMLVLGLTEHMPRGTEYLYPEEKEAGLNAGALSKQFENYVREARRLRSQLEKEQEHAREDNSTESKGSDMQILIGLETEWLHPEESTQQVHSLMAQHNLDYFIGSVHHVRTIAIDFSKELYLKAREACGATDEALFAAYFDEQYDMLQALKPRVVGHFDLIRLLSDTPDLKWSQSSPALWDKIQRNLSFTASYGGLLEINTAAWRKGLAEPYPTSEICREFLRMGGKFVLSDDSHGVDQFGTNYQRLPMFLNEVGIGEVAYLSKERGVVVTRTIAVEELMRLGFWQG